MATPIHSRLTGEIWDMSIDDLLAPMTEMPRLGGTGPFVINLSTASTPIEAASKTLTGVDNVHVYQIQRIEDRRLRYRLRLGPFHSEDDADAALIKAREIFPGALTATAGEDDLQAIAPLQARASAIAARPAAQAAPNEAPRPMPGTLPALPALTVPAVPAVPAVPPVSTVPVMPTTAAVANAAASVQKTAAAAPVAPKAPTPSPVVTPVALPKPVATAASKPVPPAAAPSRASAPPPKGIRAAPPPALLGRQAQSPVRQNLESTQTMRPLTALELAADDASQWYVIQLSTADQAFDPDTLPNLDIFSAYRLYSVAGLEQDRVVHALRLGFFGAEIAARAVMSYVSTYYDKATITRVSVAERERFATQRLEARKDVGATGRHAVIEITDERVVRARRTTPLQDPRGDATASASP